MVSRSVGVVALVGLLSVVVTGCHTAERVVEHERFASLWKGLSLYRVDDQIVYATSAGAADDLQELAVGVAAEFESLTGGAAASLVLIAREDGQLLLADDLDAELEAVIIENALVLDRDRDPQEAVAEFRREMKREEQGASTMLGMRPSVVRTSSLFESMVTPGAVSEELDKPNDTPSGEPSLAVIVPTDRYLGDVVAQMIDLGLEREKVGWGKRVLMAPLMPMVRGMLRDQMRELFRMTLFSAHAECQDWTDEVRREHVEAYTAFVLERSRKDAEAERKELSPPEKATGE